MKFALGLSGFCIGILSFGISTFTLTESELVIGYAISLIIIVISIYYLENDIKDVNVAEGESQ